MSAYSEYFLSSSSSIVQLETFEISHVSFSKSYFIVRNSTSGFSALDENGKAISFNYYPVTIEPSGLSNDIDFGIKITFGDLGEILPFEMDRIANAGTFTTKPTVVYRTWRSDDLSTPLVGPIELEVSSFSFTSGAATFEAAAPQANINQTGEIYTINRFPMLKAYQ